MSAILEFLSSQFDSGKQYRTLNSYRSAISMTHLPVDGIVVGKHPLVTRLMKGIFNSRPPQPKYGHTWEVGHVLDYLRSLGTNHSLSLKQLSAKLAVLLALANASRASEIHALDTRFMSKRDGIVTFAFHQLTKTSRPGKTKEVHYFPLKRDVDLCPVATLDDYIQRTDGPRKVDPSKSQLFLSVVKPFNPVTKATIARWVKSLIGVGHQFGAHSIRGAVSTAACMGGMSVEDIIRIADWSSDSVFKAFYYKPIHPKPMSLLNALAKADGLHFMVM